MCKERKMKSTAFSNKLKSTAFSKFKILHDNTAVNIRQQYLIFNGILARK